VQTQVEEVVVVLPSARLICGDPGRRTRSVVKLGTGSSVAFTKSSTEPSCKKQFIWFFGTPRACQLNDLSSAYIISTSYLGQE
jgi:hypothetical protein